MITYEQLERKPSSEESKKRIKRLYSTTGLRYKWNKLYEPKCCICGWCDGKGLNMGNELHHIVPVNKGGTNTMSNVVLLCPNHHHQADKRIISTEILFMNRGNYKRHIKTKAQELQIFYKAFEDIKL